MRIKPQFVRPPYVYSCSLRLILRARSCRWSYVIVTLSFKRVSTKCMGAILAHMGIQLSTIPERRFTDMFRKNLYPQSTAVKCDASCCES